MATTTFSAIRTAFYAAIAARTPTLYRDQRFRRYDGDAEDLAAWAVQVGEGAFRTFDLRHGFDTTFKPPHDLVAYLATHSLVVELAYPHVSLRYGADVDPNGEAAIDGDLYDINQAIGQPGSSSWPAGVHDCAFDVSSLASAGGVRVLRLVFLLTYNRSVPS